MLSALRTSCVFGHDGSSPEYYCEEPWIPLPPTLFIMVLGSV